MTILLRGGWCGRFCVCWAFLTIACGTPTNTSGTGGAFDAGDAMDVPGGDGVPIDGSATDCSLARDCDDGVPCTEDSCVKGRCVYTPTNARCDDRIGCTENVCTATGCRATAVPARCSVGQTCDPAMGCTGGQICATDRDCADMSPCTVNERCDSASRVCRNDTLDGDGDGHPPRVCGGDDCDDSMTGVFAGAPEICNGADDDCDGVIDGAAADRACAAMGTGQVCGAGPACRCAMATQFACDGACRDLRTDSNHCGVCGIVCGPMMRCADGVCACLPGLVGCPGAGGCINTQTNPGYCGSCATVCPMGATCVAGRCACPGGSVDCSGRCTDPMTDGANCGRCGAACPMGSTCRAGRCECAAGLTMCGDLCVNIRTDGTNCGRCGNTCRGDGDAGYVSEMCVDGACRCPSGTGMLCTEPGRGEQCVDVRVDRRHCGACGASCPAAASCMAGACRCHDGTMTVCNAQCVSTMADSANCGRCGNACPSGGTCRSGACVCVASGLTLCGSNCLDLQTSAANCGRCGNACATGTECVAGRCAAPATLWARSVGSVGIDRGEAVAADASGNTYLAGFAADAVMDTGSASGEHFFLTSYSPTGVQRWMRSIPLASGSLFTSFITAIAVDSGGNLYFGGQFGSTVDFASTRRTSLTSEGNAFVASYDRDGTYRWSIAFATARGSVVRGIATDASNNVYLTGEHAARIDLGGGALSVTSGAFLASFTSAGTHRWSRGYLAPSARDVDVDSRGSVLMYGVSSAITDFGGGTAGATGLSEDVYVASFSTGGAWQWDRRFEVSLPITSKMSAGPSGIVLSGAYSGHGNFGPVTINSTSGFDAFVVALDVNGGPRWARTFGGPIADVATDVAIDRTGGSSQSDTTEEW
jgi:hypothetical protein